MITKVARGNMIRVILSVLKNKRTSKYIRVHGIIKEWIEVDFNIKNCHERQRLISGSLL